MKQTLGLAAMLFLAVTGCSTNRHMLEPGHDKRANVSPEMSSPRQHATTHPPSGSLTGDGNGPCPYRPPHAGDVIEGEPREDDLDVCPECDVIP